MIERVVTFGEALGVFHATVDRPLWHADSVAVGTGGAEGNVAMAVARQGVPVTWAGRVGDDALGRRIIRELRGEGVDTLAITDRAAPTGLLIKESHPGGRTTVVYYRHGSAGSRATPEDVDRIPLSSSHLVHLTGITSALSASARAASERLLDRAAEAGATVSFDVNHRSRLWDAETAAPVYRGIAERADIVFASVDEVPMLVTGWTGDDPRAAAAALATAGHRHVVVTAGEHGAVAIVDGQEFAVAAVPVTAVDSVGAGDAFVGGYLAALALDQDVQSGLRRGALLGAAACRHPGDWEGVADLDGLQGGTGDTVLR
jgi:2-dehydro-3-deoxygluconokinase